jgi:hypothetical protein
MTEILRIAGNSVYNLTVDFVGSVIFDGPGATLNGNGHVIYSPFASDSIPHGTEGVYSAYANTTVNGVIVSGAFGYGIRLLGDNSHADNDVVGDSELAGIIIAGKHSTASNDVVHDIGGNFSIPAEHHDVAWGTFGIVAYGEDDNLVNDNTFRIDGTYYSTNYQVTGPNSHMRDDLAQGGGENSWSTGLWSENGVHVDHSAFVGGLDVGIANKANTVVNNTTLNDYHDDIVNFADGSGGNIQTAPLPDTHYYILGTPGHDHIVAGDNNNFIVGNGESNSAGEGDVIYSGKGNDIIACAYGGALTALPDFEQGADKINTAYWSHPGDVLTNGIYSVTDGPAFFFNPYDGVLAYDPDGRAGAPAQEIAFLPYVTALHHDDLFWW